MKALRQDVDVEKALRTNDFATIKAWLASHIHTHGGVYEPRELLMSVTGEPFNPQYYVDYLKDKVTQRYHL